MVVNRTQSLVLGFFVFAWIGLVVILLLDPTIWVVGSVLRYDEGGVLRWCNA